MIILIDSSSSVCRISFVDGEKRYDYKWQADRMLSKGLLGYLDKLIKGHKKSWTNISAIGVFEGPGSFTGIRIGLTVMNTIADSQNIPIVGGRGKDWQNEVLKKIRSGENKEIVLPFYNRGANITIAKK